VTEKNLSFFHRLMWYVSIGISLGGAGIWAMHFIGMTALSISDTETGALEDQVQCGSVTVVDCDSGGDDFFGSID
jgi:hypothetical protein